MPPYICLGGKLAEVFPELKGQPYLEILDDVYANGETYKRSDALCLLEQEGKLMEFFVNFVYQALLDKDGVVNSIMIVNLSIGARLFQGLFWINQFR